MDRKLNRRSIVRIISFSVALILLLLAGIIHYNSRAKTAELALEYSYLKAVEDLSLSADNISNSLQKGLYSGTPEMLSSLSNDLLLDSSTAKACLAQLSTSEQSLEGASKFLSQVGNYALSLSEKLANGGKISNEEYDTLEKLYEYSNKFKENLWSIEKSIAGTGDKISYETVSKLSNLDDDQIQDNEDIATTFSDLEESFENYPTLIYDGPFSDHILEKEPEMTKNAEEIDEANAKHRASEVSLVQEENLTLTNTEDGKMPSFVFEGDDTTVAVTKHGGYCSYMIKSRDVSESNIKNEEAVEYAKGYLSELGIYEMESTYYETIENVCTVNFAFKKNDVLYYTDLIKVKVALDNGQILGFDARGFLVNHKERKIENPKLEAADAKKIISPKLKVSSVQKVLIPKDSTNEVLCYEFKCKTESKSNVLVYVNCATGKEEQILILIESESGVLTV